ncbi:TatD family hydrolase [Desulfosediminicola ganghwensis]|uniref:TatD family hydrolase n=1 Tax=Desulfosediminicola ganghwensis TaxID=2569540 RepID=UPI001E33950A|nr:TatD family hydrolase [Desulfosediminicola ganghwensis]
MSKRKIIFPELSSGVKLIDTHCHLDMDAYQEDFDEVLARAEQHGIGHIITIGIDLQSSIRATELAAAHQNISATIGIHPHDVDNVTDKTYLALGDLVEKQREHIVGYGEIGLDYVKEYSAADNQRRHFARQLSFARELGLPIVIHDREAHQDTLKLLKESGATENGGIMHCFSGDIGLAREVIDLGLHISLPGVVTFKNATELQHVAREIPLESLLVETDGPFLSPHPLRGKRNEPGNVIFTAACIAELRGMDLDDIARQTTRNAIRVFQLNLPTTGKSQ